MHLLPFTGQARGEQRIARAVTGQIGYWGCIGVVPLLTGVFSFCPLHRALGMNTCGPNR